MVVYVSFIIVRFWGSSFSKWLLGACRYVSFILGLWGSVRGRMGEISGQVVAGGLEEWVGLV